MKTLIIVESAAKCEKISSYAGKDYICMASLGHVNNLKGLGDIDKDYNAKYTIIDEKKNHINKLQKVINSVDKIIIGTDNDREGEAIGFHLCKIFRLPVETTTRILFNEITKSAIINSLKNPTKINLDLVNAQQTRQILDMIVGYKISPMLWKHISRNSKSKLSAGRCQTPALRIIYDNYIEIKNSSGKLIYNIHGYFTKLNLRFVLNNSFEDNNNVDNFLEKSHEHDHIFSKKKTKQIIKKCPLPFSTSLLQQKASNEFKFSPKETMALCKKLYQKGIITYPRTDTKTYCQQFIDNTKNFIETKWGEKYINKNINKLLNTNSEKKEDKNTQGAHEAIRPTDIKLVDYEDAENNKEKKLYKLIWKNSCQSCMSEALFQQTPYTISAPDNLFYKLNLEKCIFKGWTILNKDENNEKENNFLTSLKNNCILDYNKINSVPQITNIKNHYTEAKLIQLLESKGIGRPSTFSNIVEKIQERKYVIKQDVPGKKIKCIINELCDGEISETVIEKEFGNEKKKLVIQPLGILVVEFLIQHFNTLFEYDYTCNMENDLDKIANGEINWRNICKNCDIEIEMLSQTLGDKGKTQIKIDDKHTYIIGKYGPVIKYNHKDITEFKQVKSDLCIDKLRRGFYSLDEIIETKNHEKCVGIHNDEKIYLKKGKFGLYVNLNNKNHSLKDINIEESEITLQHILNFIEKPKNLIRKIDENISIKNGKYGNYISIKNGSKKPKFVSLKNFKEDITTCNSQLIYDFISN